MIHTTNVKPDYARGDKRRAIPWSAGCTCGWLGAARRDVSCALLDAANHKTQEAQK